MIKSCLLLICTIQLMILQCEGQRWATTGATWTYSFNALFSFGYVKIEQIGDTLINNKNCDIFKKVKFGYTFPGVYDTLDLGHEYTYFDSSKVFIYRNNQFWILYDFNAPVGSSWFCPGNNSICPSMGEYHVDSVGNMVINNDTLRVIFTSPAVNSGWHFVERIVEKIGCMGYLFPEPRCQFDSEEGGPLRCYTDSTSWSYNSGISSSCDYLNSIYSFDELNALKIYPNPSFSEFTIEAIPDYSNAKFDIYIHNFQGETKTPASKTLL